MADINLIDVPFLDWPLSVLSSTNTPPGSPSLGDAYVVGSAPTGAWSGHANAIARWNDASAWEYQTPAVGRTVWNIATSAFNRWTGSAWSVLNDLPNGGTIGQVLAKTSGSDYAVAWADNHDVPAGGSAGQALKKTTGTDYDATWAATHEVPAGGSAGQALRKTTGTDYDATWTAVHEVPAGGTTGQALVKSSGTDYATTWSTISGGSGGPTTIYYFADPLTMTNATGAIGDISYVAGTGPGSNTLWYKDASNVWQVGATLSSGASGVTSIFGRTGTVTAQSGDYTATQIGLGNVTNDAQLKRAANDFSTFSSKTANGNERILIEDIDAAGVKKFTTSAAIAALATPSGTAGGDLGGTYPSPTVTQSRGLKSATTTVSVSSAAAPTNGQVLTATSGTAATWQTPAGGAPSGSAGGDLGGTYPNPTVTQARGLVTATGTVAVSAATAPTTGQVLTATSATTAVWQAPTGGAATDLATTGANVNINAAAPPSAGQALIATDATHATWQTISGGSSSTGNPYIDAPSSPHADNDEFTSWPGSWVVYDITTATVLTGSSGIDPWTYPSAGTYRYKQVGSTVVLQFPKTNDAIVIYKAFTLTAAGSIVWGRIGGWGQFNSGGYDNTYASYGISVWTNNAGRPQLSNRMSALVENQNGTSGRFTVAYVNGTSRVGNQNLIGQVAPDIMAVYVRSSPTAIGQPFWVSSAGGDVIASGVSDTWNSGTTTYAYAGFWVQAPAVGSAGTICPTLTLDYYRRVDGATAWIV